MEDIVIYSVNGEVLRQVPLTDKAQFSAKLMGEEIVTLQWYAPKGDFLPALSTIRYNGKSYRLRDDYTPTYNNGVYDYSPSFVGVIGMLSCQLFARYVNITEQDGTQHRFEEVQFSINANLATMAVLLNQAIEPWGLFIPISEDYMGTKNVAFSFDGTTIADAIAQVAEAFEMEWGEIAGSIFFMKRFELPTRPLTMGDDTTDPDTFSLSRCEVSATTSLCPRYLKVFGSERNILPRKVNKEGLNMEYFKRLRLDPSQTIPDTLQGLVRIADDSRLEFLNVSNVREELLVIDEVYPHYEGAVTNLIEGTPVTDQEGNTQRIYTIEDTGIKFPINYADGVADGDNICIVFSSGPLNGMEFKVNARRASVGYLFEIIANTDYGTLLPNETIHPQVGDRYVPYNFLLPDDGAQFSFYATARRELLNKASEYALTLLENLPECRCTSDEVAFHRYNYSLQIGQRINLVSRSFPKLKADALSRITSVQYPLTKPFRVQFTVASQPAKGRLDQLKQDIRDAEEAQKPQIARLIEMGRDGAITDAERTSIRLQMQQIEQRSEELIASAIINGMRQVTSSNSIKEDKELADYRIALSDLQDYMQPILATVGTYQVNANQYSKAWQDYYNAEAVLSSAISSDSEPNIIRHFDYEWEVGTFRPVAGKTIDEIKTASTSTMRSRFTIPCNGHLSIKSWSDTNTTFRVVLFDKLGKCLGTATLATNGQYTHENVASFAIYYPYTSSETPKSKKFMGVRKYGSYPPFIEYKTTHNFRSDLLSDLTTLNVQSAQTEQSISVINSNITTVTGRVTTAEGKIKTIENTAVTNDELVKVLENYPKTERLTALSDLVTLQGTKLQQVGKQDFFEVNDSNVSQFQKRVGDIVYIDTTLIDYNRILLNFSVPRYVNINLSLNQTIHLASSNAVFYIGFNYRDRVTKFVTNNPPTYSEFQNAPWEFVCSQKREWIFQRLGSDIAIDASTGICAEYVYYQSHKFSC